VTAQGVVPLLSVLTPVRNAAPLLERCVVSVLELGRTDIEHLVIDGGSTDDTAEVGQALADRYPGRVRFESIPDKSMTEGLINAVDRSRGTYIAPLNADDRYLPGMGRVVDLLATDSPRAVFGNCRIVRDDGSLKYVTRPWLADHLAAWHLLGCISPECGYVIARSSYDDIGGYRTAFRFTQDYDMLLRLVRQHSVRYVDADVGEFVASRFSVSAHHRDDMLKESVQVNALGPISAWIQLLRVDKIGRTMLGIQRYRVPHWPWSRRDR
jgi:glycosyltransferase involved in cell wall biosynthesis